jgi:hypothetical protein
MPTSINDYTDCVIYPQEKEWKDYDTAFLINELRDIALKYRDAQQLRERIAYAIRPLCDRLKK